jgi:hypothetical protein
MITFKIFGVRNSANTKITLPFFNIEAFNTNGQKISVYSPVGPSVRNLYPEVAFGFLSQTDKLLGATTDYTITYTTKNYLPSGATYLL